MIVLTPYIGSKLRVLASGNRRFESLIKLYQRYHGDTKRIYNKFCENN